MKNNVSENNEMICIVTSEIYIFFMVEEYFVTFRV